MQIDNFDNVSNRPRDFEYILGERTAQGYLIPTWITFESSTILGILQYFCRDCIVFGLNTSKSKYLPQKHSGPCSQRFPRCFGGVRRPDEWISSDFVKNDWFGMDLSEIKGFHCRSSDERSHVYRNRDFCSIFTIVMKPVMNWIPWKYENKGVQWWLT